MTVNDTSISKIIIPEIVCGGCNAKLSGTTKHCEFCGALLNFTNNETNEKTDELFELGIKCHICGKQFKNIEEMLNHREPIIKGG